MVCVSIFIELLEMNKARDFCVVSGLQDRTVTRQVFLTCMFVTIFSAGNDQSMTSVGLSLNCNTDATLLIIFLFFCLSAF
mgnify:CR=1 FL=1